MKQVYLLSGISGSGKSTWRKEFEQNNKNLNICTLSSDDIREELGLSPQDDSVFKIIDDRYSKAISAKEIDVIIIDATNLTHKRRIRYKRKDATIKIILFFTSLSTALTRVRGREKLSEIPYESLVTQSIALMPPIVGYDCDSFELYGESFFKNGLRKKLKPNYRIFLATMSSITDFLPLVNDSVLENELNGIFNGHNSLFHKETINEHIDLCLSISNSIDMKIISLFHDLGKPIARVDSKEKGYTSFKRHERFSSIMFLNFLYSFTNEYQSEQKENNILLLGIFFHMLTFKLTTKNIMKYNMSEQLIDLLLEFNVIDKQSSI